MRLVAALGCSALVVGCKPSKQPEKNSPPPAEASIATPLAGARMDVAMARLGQGRPDEALGFTLSAWAAAPTSAEARALTATLLKQTVWNFPEVTLAHPLPVEHLECDAESALWVGLGRQTNTTARWDLEKLKVEEVLFPVNDASTRSFVFDSGHRWMVVERGTVSLLCDAKTLKPIIDLGPLPDFLTPSAAVVFSNDGLLVAHPAFASACDHSILWHLRDAATGQIIRSSDPSAVGEPRPLAAHLDRARLRVLRADGSFMEMPISPVEPIQEIPPHVPLHLFHGQFSADGKSVLTLQQVSPHQALVRKVISEGDANDESLDLNALTQRFPWSRNPNLWHGLMSGTDAPYEIQDGLVQLRWGSHSPIERESAVTALAIRAGHVITGQTNGMVVVHRLLPLPTERPSPEKPTAASREFLTELTKLSEALSGRRYHEETRSFARLEAAERISLLGTCDFGVIRATLPGLDFEPVLAGFRAIRQRSAEPLATAKLSDRLAQAAPLVESPAELAALQNAVENEDSPTVLAAIRGAGGKGPAAATALALALNSDRPEWIDACLSTAIDLPPLLRQLAVSRIAWLQNRKADALSGWPVVFPDLAEIRLRQDWSGWEQADFAPAFQQAQKGVTDLLNSLVIAENATPAERKAVVARLTDSATITMVGRARFAGACLKAALALASQQGESVATFTLAKIARETGAPAEPCLRAEALALTALGQYQKAHARWIELITEHPVATTLPGDYAEAAYTAFENSDPRQAMEILTTGMHRFPDDGNFALRAGWVALLTGNSERAYRFLREGKRIGFPTEKLENGTALLTIAAALTGATDDAAVYFKDLLEIDPAWADPATLDALDWPQELKSVLGQFSR